MKVAPALCALAMLALSCPAHAEEAAAVTLLKPLRPWQVDFGPTRCRAIRSFGSAEAESLLIIDQLSPRGRGRWTVTGKITEDTAGNGNGWKVAFAGPEGAVGTVVPSGGEFEGYGSALIGARLADHDESAVSLNEIEAETGERIAWVDVMTRKGEVRRLATGSLANLFTVMKRCSDDFVRAWGLDPAVEAGLTRRAAPLSTTLVYRAIGNRKRDPGSSPSDVLVRVMVDANGNATSCTVEHITIADTTDGLPCPIIGKRKFSPALNAEGAPVASYWTVTISYR